MLTMASYFRSASAGISRVLGYGKQEDRAAQPTRERSISISTKQAKHGFTEIIDIKEINEKPVMDRRSGSNVIAMKDFSRASAEITRDKLKNVNLGPNFTRGGDGIYTGQTKNATVGPYEFTKVGPENDRNQDMSNIHNEDSDYEYDRRNTETVAPKDIRFKNVSKDESNTTSEDKFQNRHVKAQIKSKIDEVENEDEFISVDEGDTQIWNESYETEEDLINFIIKEHKSNVKSRGVKLFKLCKYIFIKSIPIHLRACLWLELLNSRSVVKQKGFKENSKTSDVVLEKEVSRCLKSARYNGICESVLGPSTKRFLPIIENLKLEVKGLSMYETTKLIKEITPVCLSIVLQYSESLIELDRALEKHPNNQSLISVKKCHLDYEEVIKKNKIEPRVDIQAYFLLYSLFCYENSISWLTPEKNPTTSKTERNRTQVKANKVIKAKERFQSVLDPSSDIYKLLYKSQTPPLTDDFLKQFILSYPSKFNSKVIHKYLDFYILMPSHAAVYVLARYLTTEQSKIIEANESIKLHWKMSSIMQILELRQYLTHTLIESIGSVPLEKLSHTDTLKKIFNVDR